MLDVTFENGDHFLLAVETVLTKPRSGVTIQWPDLRLGETGDVLEVPMAEQVIEIPWDRIRSVADPDFRAHWLNHAKQSARHFGNRVRTMRIAAKLTRLELAKKVGVSSDQVAQLEAGKSEPSLDLIEHLAFALGKRLRDFSEE